jgi:Fic family protein
MERGPSGEYLTITTVGEPCRAFLPFPLPPRPAVQWTVELQRRFAAANTALGRLDGVASLLPDTHVFLYSYIRKEAVLSSQIEGTQSSLSDLLLFENNQSPGVPLDDVQEVSNYTAALEHGLKRIKEGFPLSLRLIKELHGILLSKGRGSKKLPGEFRRSQNWIGGTRPGNAHFVPSPPDRLLDSLSALEKFLHNEPEETSTLVKAALAHVQFETIHPFLDGNGRVGRLLITLLLCVEGTLQQPLLYLSLFFKQHRKHYYELLQNTREKGEWEAWLEFFFEGIAVTGNQAFDTASQLLKLFEGDRSRIKTLGRASASALELHRFFQRRPIGSIPEAHRELGISIPTLHAAAKHLVRLQILRELSKQRRYRIYSYVQYIAILNADDQVRSS